MFISLCCFAVFDERRLTIVPFSKHSRLTLDSPSTKIWPFLAFFGKIVKCALSPHFLNLIPRLYRVSAESFSLALSLPSRSHYVRTTVREGRIITISHLFYLDTFSRIYLPLHIVNHLSYLLSTILTLLVQNYQKSIIKIQ